jgi:asparagine synthase (glutamine-hydrolysing)
MCGIAGIFTTQSDTEDHLRDSCLRMMNALEHRGQDASGVYQSKGLVIGHQRLSIIDLSGSANQPMTNEDHSLRLSFNGEIYNFKELRAGLIAKGHRFRSKTDSEVIVHLYEEYGDDCLQYLRGMFAFALWDERKRRLFLARDRFGMKPLYYAERAGAFVFASELRALSASGFVSNERNQTAAVQFLQYGSVPGEDTLFKDVHLVPPGHYLINDKSGIQLKSYWSLEASFSDGQKNNHSLDIDELLSEVVHMHLTSDVPLCVLLSGGMDSSSLVALARRRRPREELHTLTISFDDDKHNESTHARLVSDQFQTRHYERQISSENVGASLSSFIGALDQPTCDGFNTFVVSQAAKEMGFRVLLSGLGGDEVFGGYAHFKKIKTFFRLLPMIAKMPLNARKFAVDNMVLGSQLLGVRAAERLNYLDDTSEHSAYRVYRGLFGPRRIMALLDCAASDVRPVPAPHITQLPSEIDRAFALEFNRYLHDQLLRDADVMSMRHSVEMRVPFLDHELVTSVLSLPADQRFDAKQQKKILRNVIKRELPDAILNRRKRGFTFPLGHWMKTSLKSHIQEVLLDPLTFRSQTPLKKSAVTKLWSDFLQDRVHWSLPWSLYVFCRWEQEQTKVAESLSLQAQTNFISNANR